MHTVDDYIVTVLQCLVAGRSLLRRGRGSSRSPLIESLSAVMTRTRRGRSSVKVMSGDLPPSPSQTARQLPRLPAITVGLIYNNNNNNYYYYYYYYYF